MRPERLSVFTIAIGKGYERLAEHTVPRFEKFLETPVTVINEPIDPYQAKLSLLSRAPEDHHVLFLDVDIVLFGWDWAPFLEGCFNAVPHQPEIMWEGYHPIRTLIGHDTPLNDGLWLAPAYFRNYFDLARNSLANELKSFPYLMGAETAVNYTLRKQLAPINTLPAPLNWQILPQQKTYPPDVLGLHLLGSTAENKLERLLYHVER